MKVFVSYNKADRDWAEWMAWQLEEEGYEAILQAWDFLPGSNFVEEMQKASHADKTVAVLSADYLCSEFTQPEWQAAFAQDPNGQKGMLIPVRVRPCNPTGILAQILWVDVLACDERSARERVIKAIGRERAKPKHPPRFPATKTAGSRPDFPRELPSENRALDSLEPLPVDRLLKLEFGVNRFFTGRIEELNRIHEELHCDSHKGLTQGQTLVICGIGGVGKTTLVRHYAEAFWRCFLHIFWVDSRKGYEKEFALIHDLLMPERKDIGLAEGDKAAVALIQLNNSDHRLLIIDNAEDETSVTPWIPKAGGCWTIITSRYNAWSSAAVKKIELTVLDKESALGFLLKRAANTSQDEDLRNVIGREDELKACRDLAQRLGYLPLAMDQAAAFIFQQGVGYGFIDYLEEFEVSTRELLNKKSLGSTEYPDSVVTTWNSSIERLKPGARAVLRFSSYLANTPLPLDFFVEAFDVVVGLAKNFGDDNELTKPSGRKTWIRSQVNSLAAYSLATLSGHNFSIHPVLKTVEFLNQTSAESEMCWDATISLLSEVAPEPLWKDDRREHWSLAVERNWAQILRHVNALEQLEYKRKDKGLSSAYMFLVINAHASTGEFQQVVPVCEELCAVLLATEGQDDPKYLEARDCLAYLQKQSGHYQEALDTFQSLEHANWKDKRDPLRIRHNIACMMRRCEDADNAESIMRDVLVERERSFGENDYETVTSIHDLGFILDKLGRLDEAEDCYRRAEERWAKTLGPANPDTRVARQNLASLFGKKGDFGRAEIAQRELLESTIKVLGTEHLDCFMLTHNLSLYAYNNGKIEEALKLSAEVVEGYRRYLPPGHRDMLTAMQDLGTILSESERFDEAEPLLREALAGYERALNKNSDDIVRTLGNLGALLTRVGRVDEATDLYQRVIDMMLEDGRDDPEIAVTMSSVALNRRDSGDFEQAEKLLRDALDIELGAYPADHPSLPHRMANLSSVLLLQDKLGEARDLLSRAYIVDGPRGDATTARILYLDIVLSYCTDSDYSDALGKMKALLLRGLIKTRNSISNKVSFATVVEFLFLHNKLSAAEREFLAALMEAINDDKKLADLERFEVWENVTPDPQ